MLRSLCFAIMKRFFAVASFLATVDIALNNFFNKICFFANGVNNFWINGKSHIAFDCYGLYSAIGLLEEALFMSEIQTYGST